MHGSQGFRHVVRHLDASFLLESEGLFLSHEGRFAEPEAEDGHAQRVEVGCRCQATEGLSVFDDAVLGIVNLWRRVDGRSALQGFRFAVFKHIGNTEVAQAAEQILFVGDENVGGLHVFVDKARIVTGIKGLGSV